MRRLLTILCLLIGGTALAQYPPQVGIAGSTAIPANDPLFVAWANSCHVQRGYQDIARPDSGRVSQGDSSLALGQADGLLVSLGDSGIAVLQFQHPIRNGAGPDFAVFENGFSNPANGEEAYMELAFVEVSSDGVNYTRFPAASTIPTTSQIAGTGQYADCRGYNNLAGKYRAGWGTPFDLQELIGSAGLDISRITHVRLIDVVGAIGAHASHDAAGRVINDPYPTPFPTGGFDLDGVGVINSTAPAGIALPDGDRPFRMYPVPTQDRLYIEGMAGNWSYRICRTDGAVVAAGQENGNAAVSVGALAAGVYFISVTGENNQVWHERICRQ
jgi:hypothetical protein